MVLSHRALGSQGDESGRGVPSSPSPLSPPPSPSSPLTPPQNLVDMQVAFLVRKAECDEETPKTMERRLIWVTSIPRCQQSNQCGRTEFSYIRSLGGGRTSCEQGDGRTRFSTSMANHQNNRQGHESWAKFDWPGWRHTTWARRSSRSDSIIKSTCR